MMCPDKLWCAVFIVDNSMTVIRTQHFDNKSTVLNFVAVTYKCAPKVLCIMVNFVTRWLNRVSVAFGAGARAYHTTKETQAVSYQGNETYRYRSRWWFLLPILVNIVGGVIAYFALRHDDPRKALDCLWCGIALFGLLLLPLAIAVLLGIATSSFID